MYFKSLRINLFTFTGANGSEPFQVKVNESLIQFLFSTANCIYLSYVSFKLGFILHKG